MKLEIIARGFVCEKEKISDSEKFAQEYNRNNKPDFFIGQKLQQNMNILEQIFSFSQNTIFFTHFYYFILLFAIIAIFLSKKVHLNLNACTYNLVFNGSFFR